jgi:hypothetical protein
MSNLAHWVIEDGLVSEQQLQQALRRQGERGIPLAMALIELELLPEAQLVELLSRRHQLPKAPRKLHKLTVPPKALTTIPQDYCWQHGLFPFGVDLPSRTLQVAIMDPADAEAVALLQKLPGGLEAELYVAGPKQVEKAIRKHFLDSLVDETGQPRLRFFGYDNMTPPSKGGARDASAESLDRIILAEPDAAPPQASAPAPEPALDRQTRSGSRVTPQPVPVVEDPGAEEPPTRRKRTSQGILPVGADGARVQALQLRVEALERALVDLLALLAHTSLDLSGRAERIAGELSRAKGPDR